LPDERFHLLARLAVSAELTQDTDDVELTILAELGARVFCPEVSKGKQALLW